MNRSQVILRSLKKVVAPVPKGTLPEDAGTFEDEVVKLSLEMALVDQVRWPAIVVHLRICHGRLVCLWAPVACPPLGVYASHRRPQVGDLVVWNLQIAIY